MRILISNDDGYLATGLELLAEAVAPLACEVLVVAPERDRSGASSSLTLDRPLSVHKSSNSFYCVNGTPTDCVHLALTGLFADWLPDLILSGINRGANMGDDTIYSGTVAAAIEGHLFNIPAMAFSLCSRSRTNLTVAGKIAQEIVRWFIQHRSQLPHDILLNVNIPDTKLEDISDWCITRLGKRHKAKDTILAKTPNDETVYWIGASGAAQDASEGTDFYAIQNKCISITPLMVDLTNQSNISQLSQCLPPFAKTTCK